MCTFSYAITSFGFKGNKFHCEDILTYYSQNVNYNQFIFFLFDEVQLYLILKFSETIYNIT
jgi:hypothetical protein